MNKAKKPYVVSTVGLRSEKYAIRPLVLVGAIVSTSLAALLFPAVWIASQEHQSASGFDGFRTGLIYNFMAVIGKVAWLPGLVMSIVNLGNIKSRLYSKGLIVLSIFLIIINILLLVIFFLMLN